MASRKQIAANRRNGRKGGVKTPEGKTISRLNARKHGIFATALTPEDSEELHGIERQLVEEMQPVGRVEEILVEKLALTYLQLQRCARAEAEYHIRTWEEPDPDTDSYAFQKLVERTRRGQHASPFRSASFSSMVNLVGLYDKRLTSQFLRLLHEIERLQRIRAGENVPAPLTGDVTIHAGAALAETPATVRETEADQPEGMSEP